MRDTYDLIKKLKLALKDRELLDGELGKLKRFLNLRTPSDFTEEYHLASDFVVRNMKQDNELLNQFITKINKVMIDSLEGHSPTDSEFYFASTLLSDLSSNWTCNHQLAETAKMAIDNCLIDDFYDMIYPSTIILGSNIFDGLDSEYFEKMVKYGTQFFTDGDKDAAAHFARGICISQKGRSLECFSPSALMLFEKESQQISSL